MYASCKAENVFFRREELTRKFSSYGQVNRNLHYYTPRTALIEKASRGLLGDSPDEGGHYLTVWAPRQAGKSSVMLEVMRRLQ
ncbi:MAG: hypothetical protein GY801_47080 [bacterium]|nr:hypothetical protein [bacterium]